MPELAGTKGENHEQSIGNEIKKKQRERSHHSQSPWTAERDYRGGEKDLAAESNSGGKKGEKTMRVRCRARPKKGGKKTRTQTGRRKGVSGRKRENRGRRVWGKKSKILQKKKKEGEGRGDLEKKRIRGLGGPLHPGIVDGKNRKQEKRSLDHSANALEGSGKDPILSYG